MPRRNQVLAEPILPVDSAPFPSLNEVRAGDFAWMVWEFGARALEKLQERQRASAAFSDRYQQFQSEEHPVLSTIYKRYRECWSEMAVAFHKMRKDPSCEGEAFKRALEAGERARDLMACLWPFVAEQVNAARRARGLGDSTLGRGRKREGLKLTIEAVELRLRQPHWTWAKLAQEFCTYGKAHAHGGHCVKRLADNRRLLRIVLRRCGIPGLRIL